MGTEKGSKKKNRESKVSREMDAQDQDVNDRCKERGCGGEEKRREERLDLEGDIKL